MVTIIALILIPVSFVAGFFCAMKALQTGLKWHIQIEKGQVPSVSAENKAHGKRAEVPNLVEQMLTGEEPPEDEE